MKKVYEKIKDLIKNEDVILAMIIDKKGSSPRSIGASMIITKDNYYFTIAGGKEEAEVIRHARSLLLDKKSDKKVYAIDNRKASDLGMICGGENTVLYQYISTFEYDMFNELDYNKDTYAVYDINLNSNLKFLDKDNRTELYLNNINLKHNSIINNYFTQKISDTKRVVIFGAGHVSRAVCQVLSFIGLDTVVIDDRQEFLIHKHFPKDTNLVYQDFNNLNFDIYSDDYVLLLTRGHKFDEIVAKYILAKISPIYIGSMGSIRKARTMKKNLLSCNFNLDNFYCPVGINIESETPEEIAISIVGQIIQIKNRKE